MRLLDLFCCEGVGATGYAAAGWTVVDPDPELITAALTTEGR